MGAENRSLRDSVEKLAAADGFEFVRDLSLPDTSLYFNSETGRNRVYDMSNGEIVQDYKPKSSETKSWRNPIERPGGGGWAREAWEFGLRKEGEV